MFVVVICTLYLDSRNLSNFRVGVLPYDHSRVPLEEDIDGIDYINASWIHNRQQIGRLASQKDDCGQKFIATPDPLSNTIIHFLQMITEQKVDAIVMLTNLPEDGK